MTKKGGIIVGEYGRIFRSGDQGHTWVSGTPVAEQSLFCLSEFDGKFVAGGLDGIIVYSNDDGKTWKRSESAQKQSIYGIDLREGEGYAVGDRGTILMTNDAGKTWKVLSVPLQIQLFWLCNVKTSPAAGSIKGFVSGAHGLIFQLKGQEISW